MPIRGAQLPEAKRHGSDQERKQQIREERIARLAPWRFQPGKSGNPGGRPKRDVASEISRAIFEENPEAIYKAQGKRIMKGDPYAFKEHAERAYGKLKESVEVSVPEELIARLVSGRKRARGA